MWTDLVLDREVSDEVLAGGLALAFDVPPAEITIVEAAGLDSASRRAPPPILVVRESLQGEYPLQISITLHRDELRHRVESDAAGEAVIAVLCAQWQCTCLFSDDGLNPFTWLRMLPDGLLQAVTVDAERLDDDQFRIASVDRVLRRIPVAV